MRFHEFVQQGDRILPYRSYFCCLAAGPVEQSGGMDGKPIDAHSAFRGLWNSRP